MVSTYACLTRAPMMVFSALVFICTSSVAHADFQISISLNGATPITYNETSTYYDPSTGNTENVYNSGQYLINVADGGKYFTVTATLTGNNTIDLQVSKIIGKTEAYNSILITASMNGLVAPPGSLTYGLSTTQGGINAANAIISAQTWADSGPSLFGSQTGSIVNTNTFYSGPNNNVNFNSSPIAYSLTTEVSISGLTTGTAQTPDTYFADDNNLLAPSATPAPGSGILLCSGLPFLALMYIRSRGRIRIHSVAG